MAEGLRIGGTETQISTVNQEQEMPQCLWDAIKPHDQLTTLPNSSGDDAECLLWEDSRLSFDAWIRSELSPWQQLLLYLKIVACYASNLAFILHERARKMEHIQRRCKYYAWRMRCITRLSLALHGVIQFQPADNDLAEIITASLHNCIYKMRSIDFFCTNIPHKAGMNQITWSMVEFKNTVSKCQKRVPAKESLDHIVYCAETCIWTADKLLQDKVRQVDEAHKLIENICSNEMREITSIANNTNVPEFIREIEQCPQDIVFKGLNWKKRQGHPVAEKKQPRDVEMELIQFHSHTYGINEPTWLAGIYTRKPFGTNSEDIDKKKNAGSKGAGPVLLNDLLVSKNYVRPKRHTMVISGDTITITRVKGSQNSTTYTIPMEEILLVTERPSGPGSNSLTIFWSSPGTPEDIDSCGIENIEIFFNDPTLQQAWAVELASVLNLGNPSNLG